MYSFNFYGHRNITAKHPITIEFTKENEIGAEGDCILGVSADFDLEEIKQFIKSLKSDKVKLEIRVGEHREIINGIINRDFNSQTEIVLRKSSYISDRTLMINANKASVGINRETVKELTRSRNGKVLILSDNG